MAGRKLELRKISERNKIDLSDNTVYENITYEIGDYEVEHIITTFEDGTVWDRVQVNNPFDLDFIPQIYFEAVGTDREFLVETKPYGELQIEDIKEIIDGYQQAIDVVEILTKEFC